MTNTISRFTLIIEDTNIDMERKNATQGITEDEITKATNVVWETFGVEKSGNMYESLLIQVRVFEVSERLQKLTLTDTPTLVHDVFEVLKRGEDKREESDGVLVTSIKQTGYMECAGRVMTASAFLQEKNIPHSVVQAPSHSVVLAEIDVNRVVYCDYNNNLFVTIPRESVVGYVDRKTLSRCYIQPFVSDGAIVNECMGVMYSDIVAVPPQEGILRQYLNNVKAALSGNPEFSLRPVEPNERLSRAMVGVMDREIGPEPEVFDTYREDTETFKTQAQEINVQFHDILSVDDQQLFDSSLVKIIEINGSRFFPHLIINPDLVTKVAEIMWDNRNNAKH